MASSSSFTSPRAVNRLASPDNARLRAKSKRLRWPTPTFSCRLRRHTDLPGRQRRRMSRFSAPRLVPPSRRGLQWCCEKSPTAIADRAPAMSAPPPVPGPRRTAAVRERGLQTISRHTRWLVAATIGLSGFFSAVAALAKPGAAQRAAAHVSTPSQSGSSTSSGGDGSSTSAPAGDSGKSGSGTSSDGGGLQAPAQSPAPASAPPTVTSGGS
jgi:hypothetical protein